MNRPSIRGVWRDDLAARGVYSEAAGIHRMVPSSVAIPRDATDVVTIMQWAAETRTSVTPRGSGSSMAGGAVGAGVIVDLSALRDIESLDVSGRCAVAGPGVTCDHLARDARAVGLRMPVDPSSAAFCTLGGMASTNAAGGRTLRYGQMNAWVRGIECVFTDGSQAWVRRGQPLPSVPALDRFSALAPQLRHDERVTPSRHSGVRKDSSGYSLASWAASGDIIDLLVGSEGTLAVFTALEIQLAPIPAHSGTLVSSFASLDSAVQAAAVAAELNASACELLDRTFLEIARSGGAPDVPDAEAVLIVEIEENDELRRDQLLAATADAFRKAGATSVLSSSDPGRSTQLWALRHAASPILAAMSDTVKSMQVIEDGAVPPARLADYVRGIRQILEGVGFKGVIFGHAGDGHVHCNVLVDVRVPGWQLRLETLFTETVDLTQRLRGTMTGEHGDGRLRAGALESVWPPSVVDRFRAIKHAFDPHGLLNPGVKFHVPGAPVLGAEIKYDPEATPIPAEARRVLDRVQKERAWNRSRLEMLNDELAR